MLSVLNARNHARDALASVGVPVLNPEDSPPASGPYIVLTVISAPAVNDWGGEVYSPVRLQVDVWGLTATASTVALKAEDARKALEGAGWTRVGGGQPLTHEGEKDAQGRRWHRASFDVTREF